MRFRFSSADIELLHLRAKALRRGTSPLPQTQALDLVAQQEGSPNLPLLHMNADAALSEEALRLWRERFRGDDRGVFTINLTLANSKLRTAASATSQDLAAPYRGLRRRAQPVS